MRCVITCCRRPVLPFGVCHVCSCASTMVTAQCAMHASASAVFGNQAPRGPVATLRTRCKPQVTSRDYKVEVHAFHVLSIFPRRRRLNPRQHVKRRGPWKGWIAVSERTISRAHLHPRVRRGGVCNLIHFFQAAA